MSDDPKQSRKRWTKYTVLAVSLLLILGIVGQWWCTRPKKTAEHFVSLLSKDQFKEAREMMRDVKSIQIADNDDVTINAKDNTTITLAAGRRRLMSGGKNSSDLNGGLTRYLGGKYDFDVAVFLTDGNSNQEYAVELHGVAIGNKIVIHTVDR